MARRLPSIGDLLRSAGETYFRFPITLISAFIFTVCTLFLIEHHNPYLFRAAFAAALGIPLFTAFESYSGLNAVPFRRRSSLIIVGAAFLLLFAFMFPESEKNFPEMHPIRFAVLLFAFHLMAAYLPVVHSADLSLFWQFNKQLFLRIVTAVIFSAVLFAGLSIAMAAIENLFAVDINNHWYPRIWVTVMGVFNTWFFLGGVPASMREIENDSSYPKELKMLTQNILLPLVLMYVVILYTYGAKILIEWDWPKGWVGYLVLGFSLMGIFSLLLMWPLRNDSTMRWVRTLQKTFYIALLPMSLLLLLAIWRRISEYGLTENRYYVAVLGAWLIVVSLYFIFSAVKNIKLIPISLSIIALVSAYGPWSSFAVSERMQLNRLDEIMRRNHLAGGSGSAGGTVKIPFKDNKEICEIVSYVTDHFGTDRLYQILPVKPAEPSGYGRNALTKQIVAGLNIPFIASWQQDFPNRAKHFMSTRASHLEIGRFDEFYDDIRLAHADSAAVIPVVNGKLQCVLSGTTLVITRTMGAQRQNTLSADLTELLHRLRKRTAVDGTDAIRVDHGEMTITAAGEGVHGMIIIENITVGDTSQALSDITLDLFIGR
jgi:hypothetical protein